MVAVYRRRLLHAVKGFCPFDLPLSERANAAPWKQKDTHRECPVETVASPSQSLVSQWRSPRTWRQWFQGNATHDLEMKRRIQDGPFAIGMWAMNLVSLGAPRGNDDTLEAEDCPLTDGHHAVLAVAYDANEAVWTIKNSWGKGSGDGGYFRIRDGACGIGRCWASIRHSHCMGKVESRVGRSAKRREELQHKLLPEFSNIMYLFLYHAMAPYMYVG